MILTKLLFFLALTSFGNSQGNSRDDDMPTWWRYMYGSKRSSDKRTCCVQNEIVQICSGGRRDQCDMDQCKEACLAEENCWYIFLSDSGECTLYDNCQSVRSASTAGVTLVKRQPSPWIWNIINGGDDVDAYGSDIMDYDEHPSGSDSGTYGSATGSDWGYGSATGSSDSAIDYGSATGSSDSAIDYGSATGSSDWEINYGSATGSSDWMIDENAAGSDWFIEDGSAATGSADDVTGSDYAINDVTGSDYAINDVTGSDYYSITDATGSDYSINDATGSDYATNDVTGSDYATDDVTGSDYAINDVTGSDYSINDATGSDYVTGSDAGDMGSDYTDDESNSYGSDYAETGSDYALPVSQTPTFAPTNEPTEIVVVEEVNAVASESPTGTPTVSVASSVPTVSPVEEAVGNEFLSNTKILAQDNLGVKIFLFAFSFSLFCGVALWYNVEKRKHSEYSKLLSEEEI